MAARKRRPSLLGALLWTGLGVAFLLSNLGIGPNFWDITARYWPILLILLGLGKVIDYYRHKEGVSLRLGELIAILFLILVGAAATRIYRSDFVRVLRDMPIRIGGTSVRPGQWLGTSYSYTQDASYTLSSPTPLRIENSYGLVSLAPGSDREIRIRLKKVVYDNDESRAKTIADEIKVEGGPEGSVEATTFVLKTNRDSLSAKDYRFNTDMEVYLPRKVQVQVRNSFGEVRAANLDGKLDLSTSHNQLEVRECSGEIIASNRYADSRLTNINGNVTVDARGRVYIETIKGDVIVRDESSPVEIRDVEGKVEASNTDSSIKVERAAKPVTINARGCQVTVDELADSVKVTTSHRRVQISRISSNVSLESGYSTATLKNIKGNVDINTNSDRIGVDDVGGYLKIKGQASGIHVNAVAGPVEINTTLKDVVVNNFESGCTVTNEYGDITLSTGTLGKGGLNAKNRNGSIQMFLPEDAAFQIEATARNGRVNSDFPGLQSSRGSDDVGILKGRVKTGGPKIVLETEYSNIQLRTRGSESGERPSAKTRRAKSVTL